MNNIVVIGGNAAGMSFAAKYKRNCPENNIIVLESKPSVSFGACGLPYFAQGNFESENTLYARTPEQIINSGIDLRINSEVINIDFEKKEVKYINDDKEQLIKYNELVISSGAKPFVPKDIELNENVQTLTTIEDGKLLKEKLNDSKIKNIAVIGAGFIGLEVVDAALHNNKKVTVIEAANRILEKQVETEFSKEIIEHLQESGVEVYLNEIVNNISSNIIVNTTKREIPVDHVVVSIGFKPNTDFIKGLEKLPNGAIITDENNMTSIKDVYAIGDCATVYNPITLKQEYIPLATVANKQGRSLADKLAQIESPFIGMMGNSALKINEIDIARVGLTTQDCIREGIDFKYKVITDKTHTSYYPNQEDIKICLVYRSDNLEILGGQILGKKDVVHRINTIAMAIRYKMTTKEFGYMDFAYAPPFSRTWEALNVAGNVCK